MSIGTWDPSWETPAIEVRVYRHGQLVLRELCESDEEAMNVVDSWAEYAGVSCQVDDLSFQHRPGDVLEPEPSESFESFEDDYPRDGGTEGEEGAR